MVKLELQNNNTTEETTIMSKDTRTLGKIIQIDDARIQDHLGELAARFSSGDSERRCLSR